MTNRRPVGSAPNLEIEIDRAEPNWPAAAEEIVQRAIMCAAARLKLCQPNNPPAELSVLLTNDAQQRQLNRDWRKIDKTTNVLSFPQIAPFTPPFGLIGDISLALETLEKESREQEKPLPDHLSHLAVHGFLHILGYDHETSQDAEQMEALEIDILDQLGLDNPYVDSQIL